MRCAIAFVALVSLLPAVGAPAEPSAAVFPPGWKQGWARSVLGRKLSYRWGYPGFAVSLLCRAVDATWAIEWEGEPPPAASPDEPVTYVFHVGLNSGTSPHRFELQLDGRPLVTFDTAGGTENRAWTVEGQDGARLQLLTTRIGSFDERFGFMALTVPRSRLGDAPPRFRIVPEAAGSQDYVLVFEEPVTAWAKVGGGGGRPEGRPAAAHGRREPPRPRRAGAWSRSRAARSTAGSWAPATRASRSGCPRA